MIQHLGEKREAHVEKRQEMFKKDLEELKYKQTDEQYSNWNERITLQGINSRATEEEQITGLEDKVVKITPRKQNKKNEKKWRQSKRPLGQHLEKIFEMIITENFPSRERN